MRENFIRFIVLIFNKMPRISGGDMMFKIKPLSLSFKKALISIAGRYLAIPAIALIPILNLFSIYKTEYSNILIYFSAPGVRSARFIFL